MEEEEPSRISLLLGRVSGGEAAALPLVFEAAYHELCTLARARLRGGGRSTPESLESATLVHEVFMRLVERGELKAPHRPHFFKYVGKVMRSVIVDSVRERLAQRRGGGAFHKAIAPDEELAAAGSDAAMVRVHEALAALSAERPELSEIVQLRFFGGLTDAEIAEALGVTDRTVRRRWEQARAFLGNALRAA